ncbi:glycosyltransferase family 4 protein [Pseudoxanthomonas sangjuensis]|uniref:glycosyltransferase family 4 protein n=1 Tax=Pseudoxanthomonas sangjuensis TaxID=1503750 RepID=UPI0013919FA5|nr:glycosyltransferase family 4 protein [Pseudoxanthomonas sangjuensis]KAF1714107.1 glycosyltransferase family 1 protein [Pseudoxanthomonas sangjuensis]
MRIVFFANTDWYLYNFRLATALRLQECGVEVVMLSPPGEFGGRFRSHGIRWRTLPMRRASLNPLRELWTLGHLVRLLWSERPDLLHNFTVKCAIYGGIAAGLARVPAVVNAIAGMGFVFASDRPKARALRPLVRALMRIALGGRRSRVILQNPDDARTLTEARLVPERSIRLILGSGVDVRRFRPQPARARSRPLRVLLASRLVREKGVGEFAEAARLLRTQARDIEFLLAGMPDAGNPGSIGRDEVEAWQREGRLRWLGHVEDMPALLNSVDVMVLPSYYREGVPRCLLEGAASGLGLITTDRPGCREVVTAHGVEGLWVRPRDAPGLARLLVQLDADRDLLQRLGAAARRRAVRDFDERLVIGRTLEVYDELLPAPLPGAAAANGQVRSP